jgi:serine/threonine protein kinase
MSKSTTAVSYYFAAPELLGACSECGDAECNCGEDEQYKAKKSFRTDIYAFGCLYYQVNIGDG